MKIVTFATHSQGTFDELTNSGYPIKVVGWGTKWNGFVARNKDIIEYLDTLPNDEIVVIVDGFDTLINKSLDNLESDFKKLDCKVLYSLSDNKSGLSGIVPDFILNYLANKVYKPCKDGKSANAGLSMGYVQYVKIVLKEILKSPYTCDQMYLNMICPQFSFLKIDTEYVIFQNLSSKDDKSNAYFKGYPGEFSIKRKLREFKEYGRYFIPEIICCVLIIFVLYNVVHRYATGR